MAVIVSDDTGDAMLAVISASGVYASLHTANPGSTGASELSATGYARVAVNMIPIDPQIISNDANVSFGPASGGDWTEVSYWGLWDAVSGGNFVASGPLNSPVTVLSGDYGLFSTNNLVLNTVVD